MCVIIHKPADARPSLEVLEACAINNPDGWGIMFVDDGRVQTLKDVDNTKFFRVYEDLKDRELGIHFRWKTHGLIDFENTHPYRVLHPKKHGSDVWLMHNGVISIKQRDRSKSDTWHFVNNLLQPILAQTGSHVLRVPEFQDLLEQYIGYGSKLLLLDEENTFVKVNEDAGMELEGCWLSNSYSHRINQWSGKESQAACRNRGKLGYGSYGGRYNYGMASAEDPSWWDDDPNNDESPSTNSSKGIVQEGSNGVALLPAPDSSDYPLGAIEKRLDEAEQLDEIKEKLDRVEEIDRILAEREEAEEEDARIFLLEERSREADEEEAVTFDPDNPEDYYRGAEGKEHFLPCPEELAQFHEVDWDDLMHLSGIELKEYFKLRPDVAARLFLEATA